MNKFKKRHINIIKGRISSLKDFKQQFPECSIEIDIRIKECETLIEFIIIDLGGHK